MIGIELFSGAGGMSLGARLAGINIVLAIEKDKSACATYKKNHSNTKIINDDIRNVSTINILTQGNQIILFGGPPCRGFSTSNQKTRDARNPFNQLYQEFLRFTEQIEPVWFVFENVKGITETAKGRILKRIKKDFSDLGYTLTSWLLNSSYYGVPQKRTRFFLIGSKNGLRLKKPIPTTHEKPITVSEAIGDLPELDNGSRHYKLPYKSDNASSFAKILRGDSNFAFNNLVTRNSSYILERYKHIPQGGNWEDIPKELMGNYSNLEKCHTGIYHRLDQSKPSIVIGNYRKNMLVHPTADRGLSVREAARIQSFPDNYIFEGSIGKQQQQVGNAVPPKLAKAVFEEILLN